jgi:photosystem II stability/assembly factor-like uncharacterized protein
LTFHQDLFIFCPLLQSGNRSSSVAHSNQESNFMRTFMLGLFFVLFFLPAMPQNKSVLHVGAAKSNGYVVGAKLSASGLHRFDGDTVWTHLGRNTPRVSGIACDPTNPNIIFLACGNGAARTLDGGKSWRITTDWRVTEAQAIAVDPNAPQHVYLATAYGIWCTHDRGDTWKECSAGLNKKYTQTIAVDRTQAGRVLAGTEGGLYLSTDGAKSWSLVGPENVAILDIKQSASSPPIWLAATQENGVLLSADDGKRWQLAKGGIAKASIYAVAIDPFDAKNMAAVSWGAGVFVSADGGKTWQQRNRGLPVLNLYQTIFDANHPGRLWAATFEEGIFHSDDMGQTWRYAGLYGAMVFDMVFIPIAD